MKKLYIQFAGYTIVLELHDNEYERERNVFLKTLLEVYGNCLISPTPARIDFRIDIVHKGFMHTYKENQKTHIHFYRVINTKRIETYYWISVIQLSLLFHYILFHCMKDGFFLHASSFIHHGKANIFIGPSGVGKTTTLHISKNKTIPFADDSLIVQKVNNTFLCFQTPFIDKQTYIQKTHKGYPVNGIYLLKKSRRPQLKLISKESLSYYLIQSLFANQTTNQKFSQTLLNFIEKSKSWESGILFSTGRISTLTTTKITR